MKPFALAWRSHLILLVFVGIPAVPGWIILQHERVLHHGKIYKIRARAYDPIDPLRGHYLRAGLWIENQIVDSDKVTARPNDWSPRLYASLATDEKGFARITALGPEKPTSGDYVACSLTWNPVMLTVPADRATTATVQNSIINADDPGPGKSRLSVTLGEDRFYVSETEAQSLEAEWNKASRNGKAWAQVRVLGGRSVIESLHPGE